MYKVYYLKDGTRINYEDLSQSGRYLIDLDERPEIGSNLEIDNNLYSVCMIMEHNMVGVRAFNFKDDDEVDETLESEFTCPYCGHIYQDAFELEDTGERTCTRCNSELEFERVVTVEYSVIPKKKADVIKIR
ncbi:hypothetical protein [Clostridium magnum]|uniref:Uncharacterized protein n=1 Tax=Clostridium magnum DSM 2767 TaxID=1121326 RepID=A0A162QN78_9CLOT|nr:hypothetical protein [Clostridium magnum]KZL88653.1 hypothetical protein CLMAG_59420 [Clostridium magnum DSM 2767]KZL88743.1 hypothetical protein CLMAG_60320 [Clostridium magnum DSM 2767]SHJ61569.1 hypothetical protein SAMN02745944_06238 [Clostridium magnum DSM 2767]